MDVTRDGFLFLEKTELYYTDIVSFISDLLTFYARRCQCDVAKGTLRMVPAYVQMNTSPNNRKITERTQTGRSLACFQNEKATASRPKITKSFDDIELVLMGLLNETQRRRCASRKLRQKGIKYARYEKKFRLCMLKIDIRNCEIMR